MRYGVSDGRQLMEELAGGIVTDDKLHRGFIRELEIAAAEGYLIFTAEIFGGQRRADSSVQPVLLAAAGP